MVVQQNGNVGIGTTTPTNKLTITDTANPQLTLSADAGVSQWAFRNAGGNLYFATTTVAGTATTSTSALSIFNNGNVSIGNSATANTLTVGGGSNLASISNTATSTFSHSISLSDGCFAIGNTCIGSSNGSGTVGVGTQGYVPFYNTATDVLQATSTLYIAQSGYVGIGGVTSPTNPLDVRVGGSVASPKLISFDLLGSVERIKTTSTALDLPNFIYLDSSSGDATLSNTANTQSQILLGANTTVEGQGSLYLDTFSGGGGSIFFRPLGTQKMVLTSDGKLGVNTTAPAGNLQVNDGANAFLVNASGQVGIGTTTLTSKLSVEGSVTSSGASAVAGLFASSTLSNSNGSGFQFGNRLINNVIGGTAGTEDGLFVRMIDSSSAANTVRGLEVQAYSGNNTAGVNTGIATYGKTFGLQAYTTALAGGVSQPAAVFAQLDNGGAPTIGNAIRAYSNSLTSATLVSLYHETSAFTGTGLAMNFGNNSGSFSGNFLDLQNAGVSKFRVNSVGQTIIGSAGSFNSSMLDVASSTATSNVDMFRIISDVGGAANVKFRIDSDGDVFTDGGTTIGSPADIAENYPVAEDGLEAGDVVALSTSTRVPLVDSGLQGGPLLGDSATTTISGLVKASRTERNILGIVSTKPGVLLSGNTENAVPVALAGRVPVKVSDENGAIVVGDYLTVSKLHPGYAAKALYSGTVIGQALESTPGVNGEATLSPGVSSNPNPATSTILAFVHVGWQNVDNQFVLGDNGDQLTGDVGDGAPKDAADGGFLINQKGSGSILQLQSNDQNRFMVATSGAVTILADTSCDVGGELSPGVNGAATLSPGVSSNSCANLFTVKNNSNEIFSVNVRGDVAIKGVLVATDDSFAGSIATKADGTADIDFSYNLGTGKPVVELTPESDSPVFAQVMSWKKDSDGNYTGLVVKTFGLSGTAISSTVHYVVVGKKSGYSTNGTVMNVMSSPGVGGAGAGGVSSGSEADGGDSSGVPSVSSNPASTTPDTSATTTPATGELSPGGAGGVSSGADSQSDTGGDSSGAPVSTPTTPDTQPTASASVDIPASVPASVDTNQTQ